MDDIFDGQPVDNAYNQFNGKRAEGIVLADGLGNGQVGWLVFEFALTSAEMGYDVARRARAEERFSGRH